MTDVEKALLCVAGNLLFTAMLAITWWFQRGASAALFGIVLALETVSVLGYLTVASAHQLPRALRTAMAMMRKGSVGADDLGANRTPIRGAIWVAVIFNGLAWSFVIDVSGGPGTSPYTTLVAVFIVAGQVVIITENRVGWWSTYTKSFALAVALFGMLTWLHSAHRPGFVPRHAVAAPPGYIYLAILIYSLFASTVLSAIRAASDDEPLVEVQEI